MPSYIKNQAVVHGCPEELKVDPVAVSWDITVMTQKRITMKMKAEVILGQQVAVQSDRSLETIDKLVAYDRKRARSRRSLLLMCHTWAHLCQLSQVEIRRTSKQGGAHG